MAHRRVRLDPHLVDLEYPILEGMAWNSAFTVAPSAHAIMSGSTVKAKASPMTTFLPIVAPIARKYQLMIKVPSKTASGPWQQ